MARAWIVVATGILWGAGVHGAFALDIGAVNRAEPSTKSTKAAKGFDPAMLRAQVLLDRARFSPGEIDGRDGVNVRQAIRMFEMAQGLAPDGKLGPEMWARLTASSSEPVLVEYRLTDGDVKGPFVTKIPARMEEMKNLKHLGYRGPLEALGEKFHMSEGLLKALNPGKAFDRSGDTIVVANVRSDPPDAKASKIEIDKSRKILMAFDKDGRLLAAYPASIGSTEKPAPSGTLRVTSVTKDPTYRYNPKYKFRGIKSKRPFTIEPGPNNPVGSVWINLSGEGYGIHGTPEPSNISKTASHGCIRLTNWDALELAAMVEKRTPVAFLDKIDGLDAMADASQGEVDDRQSRPAARTKR